MKFSVDEKFCKKQKLTLGEFLMALTLRQVENPKEIMESLYKKEVIVKTDGKILITQNWSNKIDEIIESSGDTVSETRLIELAEQMKEIYPPGRTPDNKYVYRGNRLENVGHLRKFFKLYGDYTDEEILDATKRYVEHFKDDKQDMRQLKYFIIKDLTKEGKGIISDLATFLENKEDVIADRIDENWTIRM